MTRQKDFSPHFRQSPLTDPWEPIYSLRQSDRVILGIEANDAHTNSRGFVHGGLIAALSDNAMGLSCAEQRGDGHSDITVNLSIDFVSVAHKGNWIEFQTQVVKLGNTISFAECHVVTADKIVARANATFKHLTQS
jgi:uncharacterized protein (TIGR00369 family)